MKIVLPLNLIATLVNLLIITFYISSISSAVIYFLTVTIILVFANRLYSPINQTLLLFNIIVFGAIFFFYYWQVGYGNNFYQGSQSDDYQYDTLWSYPYHFKHGINPDYLENEFILHNSRGYVYFIVLLREFGSYFDGYHTMMPRILNSCFLVIIAILCRRMAISNFNISNRFGNYILIAIALFPVLLFNSVHVFRDTAVTFLLVIIFYLCINLRKGKTFNLVIMLIAINMLFSLRIEIAYLACYLLFFSILLQFYQKKVVVPMIFITTIIGLIAFGPIILSILENWNQINLERTGQLGSKIYSLPIALGVIPRITFLIFTPLPLLTSFYQFYTSISAIMQVFAFPFLFGALLSEKINTPLKFNFLAIFLVVALSSASFRHVTMYLPFGIMLVFMHIYQKEKLFDSQYTLSLLGLGSCFVVGMVVAYLY